MIFKCSMCGGELNTAGVCMKCGLTHEASYKQRQRAEQRIAALEQQLAECQRKAAALDSIEAMNRAVMMHKDDGCWDALVVLPTKKDPFRTIHGKGTTPVEAIESLRKQVEGE